MKRLFALVLSAVMLLGCTAAGADRLYTSEFEDFTLQTTVPLDYSSFKVVGQPLFVYYRTVTGEVSTSAVSAINASDKPVMIVGSDSDEIVPAQISILNRAGEITNPHAVWL